ncbi:MAG: O-methyltransferase [Selenomonadales bacterium]|mgnify:FL=1|jgi:O-methyltransferase family 3|nr:MAG: O-methyltransferase [Selenomonadales bacterium]
MVTSRRTTQYLRELIGQKSKFERSPQEPCLPPESAQLLKLLARILQPERILEIGTNIGSSGIELLKAAPEARLYTIEMDELKAQTARRNFAAAGMADRAEIYLGRAEDILPYITGSYQIILLDGPKGQYASFASMLLPVLARGGLLICDNVLFRGMLSGDRRVRPRKRTLVKKLDMFLRDLSADSRLMTSILPIGDGISVSLKLE